MQDTTDTIQSKMAKARSDAKLTEAKLKKVNEQIHYLGQYLLTKSVYTHFLKSSNKSFFGITMQMKSPNMKKLSNF